jgi:hypothetical protein
VPRYGLLQGKTTVLVHEEAELPRFAMARGPTVSTLQEVLERRLEARGRLGLSKGGEDVGFLYFCIVS